LKIRTRKVLFKTLCNFQDLQSRFVHFNTKKKGKNEKKTIKKFQVINFKIIKEKHTKQLKNKTLPSVIFTFIYCHCF